MKFFNPRLVVLVMIMLISGLVFETNAAPSLSDRSGKSSALEQKAQNLFKNIRCIVCEGQSLAGSQAPIAIALRQDIRKKLKEGQTPDEIMSVLRARYGDKIAMTPPVRGDTLALWIAPIVILMTGSLLLIRVVRHD